MEKAQIEKIKSILSESPMRSLHASSQGRLFHEDGKNLENIKSILENLEGDGPKAVNIVVMGEVKSGKSTFVNALVGKEVSKMDVLEATSAIYEMVYGEHVCYDFHFQDGRVQSVFSEGEARGILESASKPGESHHLLAKVQVRLPLEILKKIQIVDTPGLHTITRENAKTTESYMDKADAILWVLNIHHLGQRDVLDEMAKSVSFGKPMIALINRLDEIEEDQEEVMAYVQDELGYLFKKMIPISAKTSWRGIVENNPAKMREGNVKEVLEYLQEHIADRSAQFMGETAIKTVQTQLTREVEIHQKIEDRIDRAFEKMSDQLRSTNANHEKIKRAIQNSVDSAFQNGSLASKLTELRMSYAHQPLHSFCQIPAVQHLLKSQVENTYEKISKRVLDGWTHYTKMMLDTEDELESENLSFRVYVSEDLAVNRVIPDRSKHETKNDVNRMSLATIVSASVLAMAAVNPVVIAGVFLGGFVLTSNLANAKSDQGEVVTLEVRGILDGLYNDQAEEMLDTLFAHNDNYCSKTKEMISAYYFDEDLDYQKVKKVQQEIRVYKEKIASLQVG